MSASQKLGEAMYAQSQAQGGAAGGGAGPAGGEAKGGDEKVVDAEYTEVKDKK
jgi:molecular chaperone DnaK